MSCSGIPQVYTATPYIGLIGATSSPGRPAEIRRQHTPATGTSSVCGRRSTLKRFCRLGGRPGLRPIEFADDERFRAWRKHLQRLQELDQGVLLDLGQVFKGVSLLERLARVRMLKRFLSLVSATDPLTFVTVPALLLLVALCVVSPARQATRVDPVEA
jgi:hypothetical protein